MPTDNIALPARTINTDAAGLAIWDRLKDYQFDEPGPYPFSKRLAKEKGWPYQYALEVLEEYRKLLFLLTTVDDQLLAAPDVEDAWRLHIIYTMNYFGKLGKDVLGKRLEHDCDDGSQTPAQMRRRFNKTLEAYRSVFGQPSEMIWFEPDWHGVPAHHALSRRVRSLFAPAPVVSISGEDNVPAEHRAIWEKLKNFQFDNPRATYPFSLRLADESFGGDVEYARLVIDEYRKFMFLLATTGHWVTPSLHTDEAWHLHQNFTRSYWDELMGKVIGKPLGHHPGNGSSEDETKFQAIYERTLADYARFFGEPPERTWGKPNPAIDWAKVLEGTGF